MNLRHWIKAGTLALTMATGITHASAATYSPAFSSPGLDPGLNFYAGPGYSYWIGGGTASISLNTPPTTGSYTSSADFYTNFSLTGNYTATVKINISGLGVSNSNFYTNAGVSVVGNGFSMSMGPYNTPAGTYTGFDHNVNGVDFGASGGQQIQVGSTLNVKIQRVGDTVSEYIAPAGSSTFTLIDSYTGANALAPEVLELTAYVNGSTPISGSTVQFSNLSISTVPLPGSLALFGSVIGGVGAFAARRHARKKTA
jgi:hypothetical protein